MDEFYPVTNEGWKIIEGKVNESLLSGMKKECRNIHSCCRLYEVHQLKEVVEIVANGNCRFPERYAGLADTYCDNSPDSTNIYCDIFRLLCIICIPSLLQEERWKDFPIYRLRHGISDLVVWYFANYHDGYDYEDEYESEGFPDISSSPRYQRFGSMVFC